MGLIDLLIHLLNFVAPALWLALLVPLAGRLFIGNGPLALVFPKQVAINFVVSTTVLALGLWFFGRDGKMATYTAMALLCGTSQWLVSRGWRA